MKLSNDELNKIMMKADDDLEALKDRCHDLYEENERLKEEKDNLYLDNTMLKMEKDIYKTGYEELKDLLSSLQNGSDS